MECFCCGQEMAIARKVKIRRWCRFSPVTYGPRSAAYQAYKEQMTCRWGVICGDCYRILDNYCGAAEIRGQTFNLAGASRSDRARSINEDQYQEWQRREAAKLGVEISA
jgi:hypothetical protein